MTTTPMLVKQTDDHHRLEQKQRGCGADASLSSVSNGNSSLRERLILIARGYTSFPIAFFLNSAIRALLPPTSTSLLSHKTCRMYANAAKYLILCASAPSFAIRLE